MVRTNPGRNRFGKMSTAVLAAAFLLAGAASSGELPVEVRRVDREQRVDILIGGIPFTSYHYGESFQDKPVFYPVLTPSQKMVNRGFPLRKDIPGESQDHPHQQSVFFAYGNVNGIDYWNPMEGRRIAHRAILDSAGGDTGLLDLLLEWVDPQGVVVLQERKRVTFGAERDVRWMDHEIWLTSLDRPVIFGDSKEGMFALRVATSLQESGGEGRYLNAFGMETSEQVWGKRAPWVALRGAVEEEPVTLAIFDHPSTENHPSYWHARRYGLFAVNPFGRKDFVRGAQPLNKHLAPHSSFHFRYRLLLYQGLVAKERLDQDYARYVQ